MVHRSTILEGQLAEVLGRHFPEVVTQWPTSKDATDVFERDQTLYAPRPDIGVGPFSIAQGNRYHEIVHDFNEHAPRRLREVLQGLDQNRNPRCLFSIEIACSGSTKHILGDITNASLMGLYGLVVVEKGSKADGKAQRVLNFLKKVKNVKLPGTPSHLFDNVL